MLAPLRDYLSPKDLKTSLLLCTTRDRYFTRLSVNIDPDKPNFTESQWIKSEDVNVEHLLDVFTTIDRNSDGVWDACTNFMMHLHWHKKQLTILKPKIEGLPDNHRSKPECLFELSGLFGSVGNQVERRRLLIHALKLQREWGSDHRVAVALRELSEANRLMDLPKEGIQHAKEALELYERLGDITQQAQCLIDLALLLASDKQFDAAEEAAFRATDLLPEKGEQFRVCRSHRALGEIYLSKGEAEKAIYHFEIAIGIASTFNWHNQLFWVHCKLAGLFRSKGRLDDAQAHVEHAKSYTVNSTYYLGYATEEQARIWHKQRRLEEAKSEALRAVDIFGKIGAAKEGEDCIKLLRDIEKELNTLVAAG